MTTYALVTAIGFSLMLGCGLILPFLSFRDRWRAHAEHRSLFDKSARQLELLQTLILALVSVLLCADLLCGGRIYAAMQGVWAWNFLGICILCGAAAILSFLALFASRQAARWISTATCLVSIVPLGAGLVCASHWLAGGGAFADTAPLAAPQDIIRLLTGQHAALFFCILAFLLAASLALACVTALCWPVVCRLKADYGRDFYTLMLGRRAQLAWKAILLLIAASAALLYVSPSLSPCWAALLRSCCGGYGAYPAYGSLAFLPLAAFLCHAVAVHPVPMQRKSLAFLSLLTLCAGIAAAALHI